MASVEATGPTVDDAIDAALDELDLDEDQVDIEVLSEGDGTSAPARVRVTAREDALTNTDEDADTDDDEEAGELDDEDDVLAEDEAQTGIDLREAVATAVAAEEEAPVWDESLAGAGREIVEDLLDYMGFPGEVDVLQAGKLAGTPTVSMAIVEGDSMGALIGRRGETLQALQFVTQLLVNRRVGHWTRVVLDVEGYRSRRERFLKDTALRAAERAMRFREPTELEPMIPSERRIVHMALADHEYVTTHSEGEGDHRRIIVEPKESYIRERGGPAPASEGGGRGRPQPAGRDGRGGRGGGGGGGGFGRGGRGGGGGGGRGFGGGGGGGGGFGRR